MLNAVFSPITRWAAVAVFCTGLASWAYAERTGRQLATDRAVKAEAAVAGRDRAIAALEADVAAARARAARFQSIRRAVDAAPPSTACASAPAIRAALDGLRELASGGGRPGDLASVQPAAPSSAP